MFARSSSWISFPLPSWEMGQFWQKTQRRLQLEEKDGAGPVVSHQGDLLPEMGVGAEDHHLGGSPAEAFLALLPVDPAPPGTELTVLEEAVGPLHPLGEFTLSFEFFIGRPPGFLLFGLGRIGNLRKKQRTACEEGTSDETADASFPYGKLRHSSYEGMVLQGDGIVKRQAWEPDRLTNFSLTFFLSVEHFSMQKWRGNRT